MRPHRCSGPTGRGGRGAGLQGVGRPAPWWRMGPGPLRRGAEDRASRPGPVLRPETVLRLLSPQDGKLSGTLELSGTPVIEVGEGFAPAVAIPPGGAAVFGFSVTAAGPVGLGVRADPDRVAVRLLDDRGETLQRGVAMLRRLQPGHYLLEASVPPDAP